MSILFVDENNYTSFERLLLDFISIFIGYIFIDVYRKLLNKSETPNSIDKMDKIILAIAALQIFFLIIYFLIDSSWILTTIRALRLIQELFLFMVLAYIIFNDELKEKAYKIVIFMLIIAGFLWFLAAVVNKSKYAYNCVRLYWIIFSLFTFILSIINLIIGIKALKLYKSYVTKDGIDYSQSDINDPYNKESFEFKNKEIQITILICVGFGSALIQLIWDLIAHCNSNKIDECINYYYSSGFLSLILVFIIKLLTFLTPPFSIYYVFYWRNKLMAEFLLSRERNISILFDYRNDGSEKGLSEKSLVI